MDIRTTRQSITSSTVIVQSGGTAELWHPLNHFAWGTGVCSVYLMHLCPLYVLCVMIVDSLIKISNNVLHTHLLSDAVTVLLVRRATLIENPPQGCLFSHVGMNAHYSHRC